MSGTSRCHLELRGILSWRLAIGAGFLEVSGGHVESFPRKPCGNPTEPLRRPPETISMPEFPEVLPEILVAPTVKSAFWKPFSSF